METIVDFLTSVMLSLCVFILYYKLKQRHSFKEKLKTIKKDDL